MEKITYDVEKAAVHFGRADVIIEIKPTFDPKKIVDELFDMDVAVIKNTDCFVQAALTKQQIDTIAKEEAVKMIYLNKGENI